MISVAVTVAYGRNRLAIAIRSKLAGYRHAQQTGLAKGANRLAIGANRLAIGANRLAIGTRTKPAGYSHTEQTGWL